MEQVEALSHNKSESKPPPLSSPSDSKTYNKAEQDFFQISSKESKQSKIIDNAINNTPSQNGPK